MRKNASVQALSDTCIRSACNGYGVAHTTPLCTYIQGAQSDILPRSPSSSWTRIIKASSNDWRYGPGPFCRLRHGLCRSRTARPSMGRHRSYPRKRPTLCRSASVRKSTCFTTSSRFADPTFQDGRIRANFPATGHTNTCFSESRKGIARDARSRSNSAISPWITSPLRAKAGPITWTTCNSCAGRAIP